MADAELDVLLEPANDLEDEIDSPEVEADVNGGGRFAGRGGGGGAGVTGGLAALGALINPLTVIVGLLTAILSQTRSVNQFTSGILSIVERTIAPLVGGLIQLLRPGIRNVTEALANVDIRGAISNIADRITRDIRRLGEDILGAVGISKDLTPDGPGGVPQGNLTEPGAPQPQFQDTETTAAQRPGGFAPPFAPELLDTINPKVADRQDEDKKEVVAGSVFQQSSEKTGGGGIG